MLFYFLPLPALDRHRFFHPPPAHRDRPLVALIGRRRARAPRATSLRGARRRRRRRRRRRSPNPSGNASGGVDDSWKYPLQGGWGMVSPVRCRVNFTFGHGAWWTFLPDIRNRGPRGVRTGQAHFFCTRKRINEVYSARVFILNLYR